MEKRQYMTPVTLSLEARTGGVIGTSIPLAISLDVDDPAFIGFGDEIDITTL